MNIVMYPYERDEKEYLNVMVTMKENSLHVLGHSLLMFPVPEMAHLAQIFRALST